jgi:dipeptidyl aminopeptidase/acylaminoacyl peptidase
MRPLSIVALALVAGVAGAQTPYQQPPAPIAAILDAPPVPAVRMSPDNRTLLIIDRAGLPPIADVAAPELRLAGDRINPVTDALSRLPTATALRLQSTAGGAEVRVALPKAPILDAFWSPDSRHVAAIVRATDSTVTPWVVDPATGAARQLATRPLNAATRMPCQWLPGDAGLVCRFRATERGPAPPLADALPTGPVIQVSSGRATPNVTYEDLLASPADEARFGYYYTSQIARLSLDGTITPLGTPDVYVTSAPSPDGHYLLVEAIHRPYSYQVPRQRFPIRIEAWDLAPAGAHLRIADLPLQESVSPSRDAVPVGPRDIRWRADAPATLSWAEATDGGDPAKAVGADSVRDRFVSLSAPFSGSPTVIAGLRSRFYDVEWVNAHLTLVREQWWKSRRTRTWAIDPSSPSSAPRLVFDRSAEDRYADPGEFVETAGAFGWPVARTTADGRSAYLVGAGASADGDRPFLDRLDLASFKPTRLWRSAAPYYDSVAIVLDPAARRVVIRRESVTDVPNYFVTDLPKGALVQLTHFADPAPQFAGVTKQLITYPRADGVQLSATLYLPAGYTPSQGPLPFFFWAYPQEFKSAAAAAQVIGSPYRFTRPTGASELFLLTQGYGVLDGPTMPIVGQGNAEPNDTYVQQLVSSAQAAVDKVVAMGVADRSRIAVGGHSYGAFMTANLLVHSTLFRAGIARSGAYNRTLTPFGFQNEERSYWQAPEIYTRMSPFTYADSLHAPLLMIHGMADDNTGTFPIQSERFYAALAGHGATVRLVMLPAEAHGYRGRESVGHTLWEMVNWLDTYVKNPKPMS